MKVFDYLKRNWITILIIVLVIILITLLILAIINLNQSEESFFLAFSTIVSSLLLAITLYVTIRNNKESSDNFFKAQEESKKQFDIERKELQKQFDEQQKFLQLQQFESTFFNMMNQLEDIVSKLTLEGIRESTERKKVIKEYEFREKIPKKELVTIIGRDVFEYFYNRAIIYISNQDIFERVRKNKSEDIEIYEDICVYESNDTDEKYLMIEGAKSVIKDLGITGYENIDNIHILDHYFRYLYRIMRFINETAFLDKDSKFVNERYKYMGILRATLSPHELVLLFYNGLSKKGNNKLKPLIERYTMLKNLRSDLLVKISVRTNTKYMVATGEVNVYISYDQSAHCMNHNSHLKNK